MRILAGHLIIKNMQRRSEPGMDITDKFLSFFRIELKESFIAAKVNLNRLVELAHDESLFDIGL